MARRDDKPPAEHSHGKCGKRWNGLTTCHCGGCCRTFTTLTAFDKHRQGLHTKVRYCADPESVGLVLTGREYECWGNPSSEDHPWGRE